MNARVRIRKEVRQLQWPWLLVMAAAGVSMFPKYSGAYWMMQFTEAAFMVGAFIGIPLLASLAVGYEFETRTFTLLLAQPIDRRRIWKEKYLVSLAAIVPPAVMFLLGRRISQSVDPNFPTMLAAWILGMCAAAPFWTIIAKSTLGGLVLDSAFHILLLAAMVWSRSDGLLIATPLSIVVYLAYIIAIAGLGRALFLRQQAIESWASEDPLSSALGRVLPRFLVSFLCSRTNTPSLNLVRRELWLLRPVWVMGLFNVLIWTGLLVFHQVPATGSQKEPSAVMIFAILLLPITAVLAGSLSLGEEKNWGTHGWHLTLPIPLAKQWSVKIAASVIAGVLCASVLPLLVLVGGGKLSGGTSVYVAHDLLWSWPLTMAGIAMAAFWCSTIVKGTVKAVLFLMAVCFGLSLTGAAGFSISDAFWQAAAVHGWFQNLFLYIDPFRGPTWESLLRFLRVQWFLLLMVALVGLQSYWLFRTRRPDGKRAVILALVPVLLLTASAGFGLTTAFAYLVGARNAEEIFFHETHTAIETFQLSIPSTSTQPLVVTVDQLSKTAPLSAITRSWLGKNAIVIHPHEELSAKNKCCGQFLSYGHKAELGEPYVAEFRLRNGMQCQLSYLKSRHGALGAECH